jgi:hypothetical protein
MEVEDMKYIGMVRFSATLKQGHNINMCSTQTVEANDREEAISKIKEIIKNKYSDAEFPSYKPFSYCKPVK